MTIHILMQLLLMVRKLSMTVVNIVESIAKLANISPIFEVIAGARQVKQGGREASPTLLEKFVRFGNKGKKLDIFKKDMKNTTFAQVKKRKKNTSKNKLACYLNGCRLVKKYTQYHNIEIHLLWHLVLRVFS